MSATSSAPPFHASSFYDDLPRIKRFEELSDANTYRALPKDWVVGVADIKDSTQAIADGKYKTVNMIGAAVISAQINGMGGQAFPYTFRGDGAAFAVAPKHRTGAEQALAAVKRWAGIEFGMELRVAMVPARAILAAGLAIGVARFQASPAVDYAMFNGGGISWAENRMKAGGYQVPAADDGVFPDLTGLSCRWSPVEARNGAIVSVVMQIAGTGTPAAYSKVVAQVLALTNQLERGGLPVPVAGPGLSWPPPGIILEARASRGARPLGNALRKILYQSFIMWVLTRTGRKMGTFDARYYARILSQNADFRKFDDGLKMTLDCDPGTLTQLEHILGQAQQEGIVKYGLLQQQRAMVTCIVPSFLQDDHVHFIDGASGGYTQAVAQIKADCIKPR